MSRPAPARVLAAAAAVVAVAAFAAGSALVGCGPRCATTSAGAGPDPEIAALAAAAGGDYLAAQRAAAEAADPAAAAQWARDQADYAAYRPLRLAELAAHPYLAARPGWSDAERLGWDNWVHWTGGTQYLWRDFAQRSDGRIELLRVLDNRLLDRGERFSRFGLINDPASAPPPRDADGSCVLDEHGLCLDAVADPQVSAATARWLGRPSGVLGLRLFDNPDFRPASWNAEDPWTLPAGCDPGARTPRVLDGPGREGSGVTPAAVTARESREDCYQPPYLVGLTCGFCHVTFDPENPPADPAAPRWDNVVAGLGNVYFQEGPLFSWVLDFGDDAFYTDYLLAQPAGTSDTSRLATDDLDNPNAINMLAQVGARLAEAESERLGHDAVAPVPHILKDGADSVGLPLAALRVYVNIGMLGNYWLNQHDSYLLLGGEPTPQRPFRIATAMRTPDYVGDHAWNQTELRVFDIAEWFGTLRPFKLERALERALQRTPGGAAHLAGDPALVADGKRVFAAHCAGCHSSKRPGYPRRDDPERWDEEMLAIVLAEDFLDGNFLSDDRRYPADAVGVNLARSMATNALAGRVWNDFSSLSYKNLPSLGRLAFADPFRAGREVAFCPPPGGRGYHRTASLVSLWATAPFFHNNLVGRHRHDPSVAGRVAAFEDAAEQLLWPERRTAPDGTAGPYVKRTGERVTWLETPSGLMVPIPPEYPIKALGNLPLHDLVERLPPRLAAALTDGSDDSRQQRKARVVARVLGNDLLRLELRRLLVDLNAAPDFIENRGHERQVADLGDDDKRALIEFMRTF